MRFNVFIVLVFLYSSLNAQININDGGTINVCSGTFIGQNLVAGNTYSLTLCSDNNSQTHIKTVFSQWNVGLSNQLCVYDGPNTNAQLIGCYNNSNWSITQSIVASQANLSGCLTFVFTYVSDEADWEANISCNFSCQPFWAELVSTVPVSLSGYTDICPGDEITFNGSGNFFVNDTLYHQDNSSCTFYWTFGDGNSANSATANHSYSQPGGYDVNLSVTDQFGCVSTNYIGHRVRVSLPPDFTGTEAENTNLCPGEVLTLSGIVNSSTWSSEPSNIVAGQTYLPDGNGDSYSTAITIDCFNPNQILDNINDLEGICVNMEHSYLDDIVISITCPNGTQVTLEDQGGGQTYLGEPVDIEGSSAPGIGYDYCWTNNAQYGIMSEAASSYTTLPAGTYTSFQSLSDLTGCPLNGVWTIIVTDNYPLDDGYIFSWGINFASHLYPNLWSFNNTYPQAGMSWSGNGVNSLGNAVVSFEASVSGSQNYVFEVIDNFGCSYDTTAQCVVLNSSDPQCCVAPQPEAGQNQIVEGLTTTLYAVPENENHSLLWTSPTSGDIVIVNPDSAITTITVSDYGEYSFIFTEDNNGCKAFDQLFVLFVEKPDSVVPITVVIPNTFTPNNDNYNDTWIISGIEDVEEVDVFVYNRFGTRVFHSSGIYQPWDGKCMGKILPTASYYYVVQVKDAGVFNGIVNIVGTY
jgi:gliding motility-associated-like protein